MSRTRQELLPAVQIVVESLTIARGGRRVIEGLSFMVGSGEALLLTGPNGAGKTTLIRTLAGFIHAEGGAIRLEPGDPDHELGALCHYVGHLNGLKANLTAAENLSFWARYLDERGPAPAEVSARVEKALETFELLELSHIPAGYMSAGQRRRLALGRLMAAERPVWLLDEPSVSLDAASTLLLAKAIDHHVGQGNIAIIATHLPLGLKQSRELTLGFRKVAA